MINRHTTAHRRHVDDRYSGDILHGHARTQAPHYPQITPELGMVVETVGAGITSGISSNTVGDEEEFVGAIVGGERTVDGDFLRLEDRHGRTRLFPLRPGGFRLEGKRVTLTRYVDPALIPTASQQSNSGSRRVTAVRARVAAPSRIWVEGIHDAAIVEKVWGHDLRVEAVAVEYMEGLDHLPQMLQDFQPNAHRRVGVLADHLIEGSKEFRLTESVGPHVLVTGHPFVDIWQAVKPGSVGIRAWPDVPRGEDWKTGVCRRLGWGSPQEGWRKVYRSVSSYRDLDASLIGAVENLIDFVTLGTSSGAPRQ